MATETIRINHDNIYDNPLKFIRALTTIEKIQPYKPITEAIVAAVDLMPLLKEMPEDLTRSEAALIVLRARLNSETDPEPEDDADEDYQRDLALGVLDKDDLSDDDGPDDTDDIMEDLGNFDMDNSPVGGTDDDKAETERSKF